MIPTGNPHIREVKEIRELIVEKTKEATGSEEDFFSPDDVEVAKADKENVNDGAQYVTPGDAGKGAWGGRGGTVVTSNEGVSTHCYCFPHLLFNLIANLIA